jgi:hypothetical protein
LPPLHFSPGAAGVAGAQDAQFDLKIGVVAGLTGDPAPDGQGWNEAAILGVKEINKSIERLGLKGITARLVKEGRLRFRILNTVRERHTRYLEPLYGIKGFWPYWGYFDLHAPPLY